MFEHIHQKKHYHTAIHVLEEGKRIDKNSLGLAADYSLQLKN
nr:hypothetical protein [Evansella caseinilytica]